MLVDTTCASADTRAIASGPQAGAKDEDEVHENAFRCTILHVRTHTSPEGDSGDSSTRPTRVNEWTPRPESAFIQPADRLERHYGGGNACLEQAMKFRSPGLLLSLLDPECVRNDTMR